MEKYITTAGLYWLGICLYFVYHLFIRRHMKDYVAMIRKDNPAIPISDAVIGGITVIVCLLCSFVWPISMIDDVIIILKGEDEL